MNREVDETEVVEEEGRSLSAMITLLTETVKELDSRLAKLEKKY